MDKEQIVSWLTIAVAKYQHLSIKIKSISSDCLCIISQTVEMKDNNSLLLTQIVIITRVVELIRENLACYSSTIAYPLKDS